MYFETTGAVDCWANLLLHFQALSSESLCFRMSIYILVGCGFFKIIYPFTIEITDQLYLHAGFNPRSENE